MKKSANDVTLLVPEVFEADDRIEAYFTLKNEKKVVGKGLIPGLNLGFNTGDSATVVQENRSRLLSQLGISPDQIAYADQIHGSRVQLVTEGRTYEETDAMVTQIPGMTLVIQVADCAAILLADSQAGVVGAVHAGWRGAASKILPKTIRVMTEIGANAANLEAFASPCISQAHFEVGEQVAEKFPARFVNYDSYEKPHVDLKGFLRFQMIDAGMNEQQIEIHEGCTVAEDDKYYSYRREKDKSGRMLALIRYTI